MIDIQQLIEADKELLLTLNGSSSLFWDGFMWTVSGTKIWIPVGAMLLYIIFKNTKFTQGLLILVMLVLTVTLADQFSSGLCKPLFMRFRPAQDPEIMYMVNVVNGYRGGAYGFISSHAANTFAVATFVALLIRNCWMTVIMYIWALIPSFSHIFRSTLSGRYYLWCCCRMCDSFIGLLAVCIYREKIFRSGPICFWTIYYHRF